MRLIVTLSFFVSLASFSPCKQQKTPPRRYFPEENNPYRFKEIYFEDKDGNIHTENLQIDNAEMKKVSPQDITLYLYTKNYPTIAMFSSLENFIKLEDGYLYNHTKSNYFIIHGWKNDHKSDINVAIKEAVLQKHDVNVFVVDWHGIADKFYITSRKAVPKIGKYLGDFINSLMKKYNLSGDMFKLVGHSLGAHIAGCAGAAVNGTVDYIVGLDPASPLFSLSNKDERLDETDARFVQVIHTSRILGFRSSIGDADYFPNNGYRQPGCGIDIVGACAHGRSYYYFAESIYKGGFAAKQCSSYDNFKDLICEHEKDSFIGTFDIDIEATGDYYLDTNEVEPFALG